MTKPIALLTVKSNNEHQLNIFDGVQLPPGEYVLVIDPRDTHGLSRAELQADDERPMKHAANCQARLNGEAIVLKCTCSAHEYGS